MKAVRLFITLFLALSIFPSCSQKRYSHLTLRVGAKKQPHAVGHAGHFVKQPQIVSSVNKASHNQPNENERTISVPNKTLGEAHRLIRSKPSSPTEETHEPTTAPTKNKTNNKSSRSFIKHRGGKIAQSTTQVNSHFLALTGLLMTMLSGLMFLRRGKMRKYIKLASDNKKTARRMLIVSRIILGASSLFVGARLYQLGLTVGNSAVWALSALLGVNAILYPNKNAKHRLWRSGLLRRKLHDLGLTVLTSAILLAGGNVASRYIVTKAPNSQFAQTIMHTAPQHDATGNENMVHQRSNGEIVANVFLTLLAILAYIALVYMVGGLVCNLSCSGYEALAAIVGIVGWGGGLVVLIFLIRSIWKPRSLPEETIPDAAPTSP